MIKNIIFDLGGVIIPLNRIACLRAFDDVVGYKDFGDVLSNYRQMGFFEKFENGEISSDQFRDIVRMNSSKTKDGKSRVISDREIDDSLNKFLCDIPQDRIDTLLYCRKRYRIFLLSNTNPICMERVPELFKEKGYDIKEIFEKLFLSYQMKLAKPSPDIFLDVLKQTGIRADETLFIDDSPANVESAGKLGFSTILFNPKEDLYDKVSKYLERQ